MSSLCKQSNFRVNRAGAQYAAPPVTRPVSAVEELAYGVYSWSSVKTVLLTRRRARYESVGVGISRHDPVGLGRSLAGVEFLARLRSSVCLALFRSGAHGLRPQRASDEQFRGCLD